MFDKRGNPCRESSIQLERGFVSVFSFTCFLSYRKIYNLKSKIENKRFLTPVPGAKIHLIFSVNLLGFQKHGFAERGKEALVGAWFQNPSEIQTGVRAHE